MDEFLKISVKELHARCGRIQTCLGKLSGDQVWMRKSPNENAVGNLVLHLCGNVRQWIGFGVAGLADIRERDAEFDAREGRQPKELAALLESVVNQAAAQIEAVDHARLAETVTIQNYTVTRMEAIYHVVAHFAEHAGQIIFATKLLTGDDLGFYQHLKKRA